MREPIERAHEDAQRQARRRAAEELCRLEVSDGPDPRYLGRRLEAAHASPGPYAARPPRTRPGSVGRASR